MGSHERGTLEYLIGAEVSMSLWRRLRMFSVLKTIQNCFVRRVRGGKVQSVWPSEARV